MLAYQNILAVIDESRDTNCLINKSFQLARKNQAHITFVKIIKPHLFSFSYDRQSTELISKHSENFSLLMKDIDSHGMDFSFRLVESSKEIEGIFQLLTEGNYDLIVKSNHKHSMGYLGFGKDEDWHLLRDIPVPVLLVGQRIWQSEGKILLALEVDEDTEIHQNFNSEMLDYSNLLSSTLGCEMHLVNCYLGEDFSIGLPAERGSCAIPQRIIHKQKVKSCISIDSIDDNNIHIIQGMPDDVIPKVAENTHADIVVLGAGEHTGFSHLISGHTSEHVIDKLSCDVLALKPH